MTGDISEGGISILLDEPLYLPYEKNIELSLFTERYRSEFKGEIVQVSEVRDKWKYAFKLSEINDYNYKQLLGIIYDRVPTLPKYIEKNKFNAAVTNNKYLPCVNIPIVFLYIHTAFCIPTI